MSNPLLTTHNSADLILVNTKSASDSILRKIASSIQHLDFFDLFTSKPMIRISFSGAVIDDSAAFGIHIQKVVSLCAPPQMRGTNTTLVVATVHSQHLVFMWGCWGPRLFTWDRNLSVTSIWM